MTRIRISWPAGAVTARLADTASARAVVDALPLQARAQLWGAEVYFDIGLRLELEPDATDVVDAGTVCFWPPGNALALPYGPTPVSRSGECRLASPVNLLGRLDGDPAVLASVNAGDRIALTAL